MREISKSVIVTHSPQQMFRLVDDVERYREFLPWCAGTDVALRDDTVTRATLHMNFRGVKQSFTTENHKIFPSAMTMKLVEGPFRSLDGQWRFTDLAGRGCKVEFLLRYDFSSRVLAALIGPVFNHIAETLVDAFVKRADKVHGAK